MKRFLLIFLVFASTAFAGNSQLATGNLKFGPATWYQPAENFPACRARGMTTICGYAATVPLDAWCAALKANGLTAWCQYTAQTAAFFAAHPEYRQLILGWIELPDEPNGGGNATPAQCADEYRSIKAAFPDWPILLNLDGRPLRSQTSLATMAAYGAAGDVLAFDYYAINDGDGPGAIVQIGNILRMLHQACPGKPVIAVLESSDQDLRVSDWGKSLDASGKVLGLSMRGPTLLEVGQSAATAVANDAAGVIWFEQVIGAGWEKFYGVPAPIEAAMPAINGILNANAQPRPPPANPATTRPVWMLDITLTVDGLVYDLVPRK